MGEHRGETKSRKGNTGKRQKGAGKGKHKAAKPAQEKKSGENDKPQAQYQASWAWPLYLFS